jgi:hypothetical protein
VAALAFSFDPVAGTPAVPLAAAVQDSTSLEAARESLEAQGLRTELDYERERATEAAAGGS